MSRVDWQALSARKESKESPSEKEEENEQNGEGEEDANVIATRKVTQLFESCSFPSFLPLLLPLLLPPPLLLVLVLHLHLRNIGRLPGMCNSLFKRRLFTPR